MLKEIEVNGYCDKRFEPVKDLFIKNFEDGLEVGASLAATIYGEFVIDIWAGFADFAQTRAWEKDTIVNVYSTTKVMTILCTLMCIDRGLLNLDAPVAKYWPEFAQGGKEKLPVRYLLSHTSGLPGWDEKLTFEDLYNWDKVVSSLAAQKPWWEPGTKCGYHSLTHGYLLGELVRRVTGKSLGTFFREEVAKPLDADFHIGLSEIHDSRVGDLTFPPPDEFVRFGELDPQSIAFRVAANPFTTRNVSKTRAWRAAEIPAGNGHGNARSIAKIAAAIACGGELDGIRLLSSNTIEKAIEEQIYDTDLVALFPIRWGLGFGLNCKERPLGPNPNSFHWSGLGGSLVVMDPDAKTSFAYAMNKMVIDLGVPTDPRADKLNITFSNIVANL